LLKRLAADLTARHRRGFSERNLEQMRLFYLAWPATVGLITFNPSLSVPAKCRRFPVTRTRSGVAKATSAKGMALGSASDTFKSPEDVGGKLSRADKSPSTASALNPNFGR